MVWSDHIQFSFIYYRIFYEYYIILEFISFVIQKYISLRGQS